MTHQIQESGLFAIFFSIYLALIGKACATNKTNVKISENSKLRNIYYINTIEFHKYQL